MSGLPAESEPEESVSEREADGSRELDEASDEEVVGAGGDALLLAAAGAFYKEKKLKKTIR